MRNVARDAQRPVLLASVRDLQTTARARRASLLARSPARVFLLGVDAAAEEVLHPELGASRAVNWLDGESAAFRDGYLEARDMLAMARTSAEPPLRLPVPEYAGRG